MSRICVGVCGSIAAYRSPDLVKELVKQGHEVQVVLTQSARELVSDRVLSTFSGRSIPSENIFAPHHSSTDHISAARWADIFVIYGATADFMARYSAGLTDDFLTLQLVATEAPVFLVPAMNPVMWNHASVKKNRETLVERGVHFIGPIHGTVACGETGDGHVAEISDIIAGLSLKNTLPPAKKLLEGKRVLISAGPMRTELDPVRYLQNRSSGVMGLEIARAVASQGGKVTVLLGPVAESVALEYAPFKVARYSQPSDYSEQLPKLFLECDVFFSLAAVLDFELVPQTKKIEREALAQKKELRSEIKPVSDQVAQVASDRKPHQTVIAFAAETGTASEIMGRARFKMEKKKVDAIVANPVWPGRGPEASENEFWIIRPNQEAVHLGPAKKSALALPLLEVLFKPCLD